MLNDEFGYWANAAHLFGYDWSGVASMSPYYSYGYSLLLTPFFILDSPSLMYQLALILNAFFYIFSYLISYKCAKQLVENLSPSMLALICMIPALYSNNLLQAHFTWTEALLYLCFWILFYLILQIERNPKPLYFVSTAVVSIYMYTVHQRTVGVLIALILSLLICKVSKKISLTNLFYFSIPFVICFLLAILIKTDFKSNVWSFVSADLAKANEYSGQFHKIFSILTDFETFLYATKGFLSKLFYLVSSSCLIFVFGMFYFIRNSRKHSRNLLLGMFCLLSLLFTLGINTVFSVKTLRIDAILYGRYTEFLVGPFLLFGILFLLNTKISWKYIPAFTIFMFLIAFFIKDYLHEGSDYLGAMSVGTSLFYNIKTDLFMVRYAVIVPLTLGSIIIIFKNIIKVKYIRFLAFIPCIIFWVLSANNVFENWVMVWQKAASELTNITSAIRETDNNYPIYFIYNENFYGDNWNAERIQFLLPEKNIKRITYDDLDSAEGDYYVIHLLEEPIDRSKFCNIATGAYFYLFVPVQSTLSDYSASNP